MEIILSLLCVGLVIGLVVIAGRAASQAEVSSLVGQAFLMRAGVRSSPEGGRRGEAQPPPRRGERGR